MKSIRLNDTIREQIIRNAIKDTRPDLDYDNVEKNEKAFAKKYGTLIYNHFYDANTRRRLKAAPKGMVPVEDSIRVKFIYKSDYEDPRYTDGRKTKTHETMHVPLPKKLPQFYLHNTSFQEVREKDLGVNGAEMVEEFRSTCTWKLRTKRRGYENELMQFLKQFTTTKQLHEAWPEGRGYLPKEEAKPKTTALTIKCDSVNKLLGLPK